MLIEFTVYHNAGMWWWEKTYKFHTLKECESYLKEIGEFATVEKITWTNPTIIDDQSRRIYMTKIKEVHTYEVDTKPAAEKKIKEVEGESKGTVTYKLSYKTKKVKGEIVDEWYLIEITQAYDTRY